MKRTELRRKTPLKRTPMKKRGRSRPSRNGAERPIVNRNLQQSYRDAVTWCELEPLLDSIGCESWLKFKANNPPGRLELHHIVNRPRMRPDALGNFLMLSGRAHDWVHANPVAGRVATLYAKATSVPKDGRPELLEDWRWSYGRCPLADIEVRLQRGEVPEEWVDCGHMLLELFSTAPRYEPDDDDWYDSAVDWEDAP